MNLSFSYDTYEGNEVSITLSFNSIESTLLNAKSIDLITFFSSLYYDSLCIKKLNSLNIAFNDDRFVITTSFIVIDAESFCSVVEMVIEFIKNELELHKIIEYTHD